jgi:hypothetical protein
VISVRENASAPTITSSIWRRIRMAIARIIRAGFRINPRCYIRVRRCSHSDHFSSTRKAKRLPNGIAFFCRNTPSVFVAEVYRKSTGDLALGKSAGKD